MTKAKGLPRTILQLEHNILDWYNKASESDIASGLAWYETAYVETGRLAGLYPEYGRDAIAGVIAALSPHVSWEVNLLDAEAILHLGKRAKVSAYGANKRKALTILAGGSPFYVLGGDKVRAFYDCIVQPRNTRSVCVDRHAARAAIDCSLADVRLYLGRKGVYEKVAATYQNVADTLGILPHQLQAIVWLAYRNQETVPF